MKKVMLLSVFLLTGCFKFDSTINKEYEFAKNFCGGESKIQNFSIHSTIPSTIYCIDGRNINIPPQ
ncbi:hypothetical protein bas28_0115 [Escherichia phage IrmaTschudi]|uniref:Lipoprotein n=2 Tax=Epseptimavirus TaxID=2732017 RepID=A0A7H0XBV2_9CAUD|nr:hypothetical protein Ace_0065a [Escherichia coli phage vB_EcoS_Ace]QXV80456.1 hypothetical protein bas28_0115 [Escherichia phage IrmaTschudi]